MGVLEDIRDELRLIRQAIQSLLPRVDTANITIQLIREEPGNMIVAKLAYPEGVLPDPDTTHAEVTVQIDGGEVSTQTLPIADVLKLEFKGAQGATLNVGYTEIDDAGNRGETKTASVVLADTFAPVTAGIGLSLVREEADPLSA